MTLFKKRGKWYIDYYYQGRRIRECGGKNKRMAEHALVARKGEIVQGRFKLEAIKPSPRFEEVVKDFLEWSRANRRSWKWDQDRVKPLLRFFYGKTMADITTWLVEKYKRYRLADTVRGRPLRGATVNRELGCLKMIFNLARERPRGIL